jgi:hypothetical protein
MASDSLGYFELLLFWIQCASGDKGCCRRPADASEAMNDERMFQIPLRNESEQIFYVGWPRQNMSVRGIDNIGYAYK